MKQNNYFLGISLVGILLFFASCGQLSSLQTGKVVGDGEITAGGAILGYGIQSEEYNGGEDLGVGVFPHVEAFGRYGVNDVVDLGIKFSTSSNILVDGKYQFIGDENSEFAAAGGGGFEFQTVNGEDQGLVYRLHFPLYFSYHPNEKSAIYATPRYIYQVVKGDNNSYFGGFSGGYSHQISPKFSLVLEGSYYWPRTQNTPSDGTNLFQFGVAGIIHLDN